MRESILIAPACMHAREEVLLYGQSKHIDIYYAERCCCSMYLEAVEVLLVYAQQHAMHFATKSSKEAQGPVADEVCQSTSYGPSQA